MNIPSDIRIDRLTTNVGAVISGVDLREDLPEETCAVLRQALLDHGVIFFRDQDLSPDQYWRFAEEFGVPQHDEFSGAPESTALTTTEATRFGTAVWHADVTSLEKPPIATVLRAVEVPPFGGDTCWSSMHAAWEALSKPVQTMLDGLSAVHTIDLTVERMRELGPAFDEAYSAHNARNQVHPVVLTHPETGRKALYVNESFTTRIVELERLESRAVLDFLFRHVGQPDFTMRWKWAANDLGVWDNRAVQHYAVPDYCSTRTMQRITLNGVRPGEPSALQRHDGRVESHAY